MNTSRTSETPLRATYMTQDEANEVMELWSERQREEAARQSLVTVHDVAEAIQVSPDHVDQLLQEVRSKRMRVPTKLHPVANSPAVSSSSEGAWAAGSIVMFFVAWLLSRETFNALAQTSCIVLTFVGISILTLCAVKAAGRWIEKNVVKIVARRGQSLTNDRY